MASFSGKKDTPETKLLQKEIESLQFKRQSLISTVQNEIQTAQQNINNLMFLIGQDVYTQHTEGTDIGDKLTTHFEGIESLKGLIVEKEEKIGDIAKRYDEEIGMLMTRLNSLQFQAVPQGMPMQPPPPGGGAAPMAGAGAFCVNCGKPYTPGRDVFCIGCGAKL